MIIRFLFFYLLALLLMGCGATPKKYHEKYYQTQICNQLDGEMEYVLEDRTRVDCLSDEYAMEVDFAKKWAESIGQALYYAYMTDKKPAVGLIVGKKDERYLKRLDAIAQRYGIRVFIIKKMD